MKRVFFRTTGAAANQSGAMEADTISFALREVQAKNGGVRKPYE